MKNNKLLVYLLVFTVIYSSSLHAEWKCFWLLHKRTYTEGEHVKSPMKVEPLYKRLISNIMFRANLVAKVERQITERTPNFLNDFEYLTERRYDNRLGKMATFFDKEFDTRVYHTVSGKANPDGSVPVVDPDSKGLFVYIHGSGTNKASGANFAYKGTELSKLGYSAISFDLPFHMDGSMRNKYKSSDGFMTMLHDFVNKYRIQGKPVYLAGHSFGPEVVFEFAKRYPNSADGIVGLSPAAFNKDLNQWFMKVTSQATEFWGDTKPNNLAGIWGGQVTTEFQWNKLDSKLPDPTVVNPNLKVIALTGEWEEYAPGPMMPNGEPAKAKRDYDICAAIKKFMKNAYCVLEPEIGHYIFMRKDEHGNDAVLRELLRVTKSTKEEMDAFPAIMQKEMKEMKKEFESRALSETDRLAQRYYREPFFKRWIDENHGGINSIQKLISENNQSEATSLLKTFDKVLQKRENALLQNIFKLKSNISFDNFVKSNEEIYIKTFGPNGDIIDNTSAQKIIGKYFEFLEKADPRIRSQFYASKEVFNIEKGVVIAQAAKAKGIVPVDGKFTIKTPNDRTLIFNPEIPPTEKEVKEAFEIMADLREAKMFRESQPVSDWLKRWIEYKTGPSKNLDSWNYKQEANDFFTDQR